MSNYCVGIVESNNYVIAYYLKYNVSLIIVKSNYYVSIVTGYKK